MSVDEGNVEEELYRADEELSYRPVVDAELLVPPLALYEQVSKPLEPNYLLHGSCAYLLCGRGFSIPVNILSDSAVAGR